MKTMQQKFFFYLTTTLLIIFSLFTFYLVKSEEVKNKKILEDKIERTTTLINQTSTKPIWSFNKNILKENCQSFFKDKEIIEISFSNVFSENNYFSLKRKNKGGKIITKMENIEYETYNLGKLTVKYTTYYLEKKLDKIRNQFILLSMISYLVVILNISLITEKITTPLSKLTDNLLNFDINEEYKLTEGIEETDIDEINNLLSCYQEMSSELSTTFEELKAQNEEIEESYKKVNKLAENLQQIIKLSSALTNSTFFKDQKKFFSQLLHIANDLIPEADYGSIYLIKGNDVQYIETIGHDLSLLKKIPIKKRHLGDFDDVGIVSNIIEKNKQLMPSDALKRLSKASKEIKSTLLVKLKRNDQWAGCITLDIDKNSNQTFSAEAINTITAFANIASAFITIKKYRTDQDKFQKEIIFSIIKLLEFHDKYTKGHSEGVAKISVKIAQRLGFDEKKIEEVYWAGMVHDIGKILVDNNILNKPSSLTDAEFEIIKKHPIWGYEVLKTSTSPKLQRIAHYILHHHERWDGNGYPCGLKGEEIPLVSQILVVADSWNTMRTNRSYQKKLPKELALQELRENKGTQFSPQIIEIALDILEEDEITQLPSVYLQN